MITYIPMGVQQQLITFNRSLYIKSAWSGTHISSYCSLNVDDQTQSIKCPLYFDQQCILCYLEGLEHWLLC